MSISAVNTTNCVFVAKNSTQNRANVETEAQTNQQATNKTLQSQNSVNQTLKKQPLDNTQVISNNSAKAQGTVGSNISVKV